MPPSFLFLLLLNDHLLDIDAPYPWAMHCAIWRALSVEVFAQLDWSRYSSKNVFLFVVFVDYSEVLFDFRFRRTGLLSRGSLHSLKLYVKSSPSCKDKLRISGKGFYPRRWPIVVVGKRFELFYQRLFLDSLLILL